jgi:hypothetical protein
MRGGRLRPEFFSRIKSSPSQKGSQKPDTRRDAVRDRVRGTPVTVGQSPIVMLSRHRQQPCRRTLCTRVLQRIDQRHFVSAPSYSDGGCLSTYRYSDIIRNEILPRKFGLWQGHVLQLHRACRNSMEFFLQSHPKILDINYLIIISFRRIRSVEGRSWESSNRRRRDGLPWTIPSWIGVSASFLVGHKGGACLLGSAIAPSHYYCRLCIRLLVFHFYTNKRVHSGVDGSRRNWGIFTSMDVWEWERWFATTAGGIVLQQRTHKYLVTPVSIYPPSDDDEGRIGGRNTFIPLPMALVCGGKCQ